MSFRATDSGPHDMCVCDDNSQTHTFYITAVELGDVNITVRVSVAACYKNNSMFGICETYTTLCCISP